MPSNYIGVPNNQGGPDINISNPVDDDPFNAALVNGDVNPLADFAGYLWARMTEFAASNYRSHSVGIGSNEVRGIFRISGASVGDPGNWVIAGFDGSAAAVSYSQDMGITWTKVNPASAHSFRAVSGGVSSVRAVAVGDSGDIYSTADGITWTQRTDPNSGANYKGVAASSTVVVAVGDGGTIISSTNGTSYTSRTSGTGNNLTSVAWSQDHSLFIAVGASGTILTSPTGTTWTSRSISSSYDLNAVACDSSGKVMAVGKKTSATTGGCVTISSDGTTYPTPTVLSGSTSTAFRCVTSFSGSQSVTGGAWVVGGDSGELFTTRIAPNSTVGWSRRPNLSGSALRSAYAGDFCDEVLLGDSAGNAWLSWTVPA